MTTDIDDEDEDYEDGLSSSLAQLGYDQIAGYFSDRALELEADFPALMEPLLYAAKSVLALGKLNERRQFTPGHLERWRMNVAWMTYAKGALQEQVAKLDVAAKDMKSDLMEDAFKSLARRGVRISDDKVQGLVRQNKDYRVLDGQLSVLRAILSTVLDHCDQYKLIKDVLVQESTLTKHLMAR